MQRNTPAVSLLTTLLTFTTVLTGQAADPQPAKNFQAIFNGKDLSGWHGLNPHRAANLTGEKRKANLAQQRAEFAAHWSIENGELVNDGHGPYATTDDDFGDIELQLQYKTVPKADSGIYLRGTPQVQIWDWNQVFNPDNPTRRPHLGSGGLFNNTPGTLGRDPFMRADKPFGKWNQIRIRQIGARTWVWLNNRATVEGAVMENYWNRDLPLPATGPVMLQTHGGEIRWRHIYVRKIGTQEARRFVQARPLLPNPTHYDVAYGTHPKQLLHFWRADIDEPTPVVFFVHGGSWLGNGRMSGLTRMLPQLLEAGLSVVSVEYRFLPEASADGVVPPVQGPLGDAARALQFVRSKSSEWNIDPHRIGAAGGSAGACTSLWLAFHPDMSDPDSVDPIARQSTRLWCAAVHGAQTTLDPAQMKAWTPNSRYGGHAFGFKPDKANNLSQFDVFLAQRDSIAPWIARYSPYALVTADDPPVHLTYNAAPAIGQPQKDPTHTANFGVKLQERCQSVGVNCELVYPGAPAVTHQTTVAYLIEKLKSNPTD
jgi:acetyl esterase/lipase